VALLVFPALGLTTSAQGGAEETLNAPEDAGVQRSRAEDPYYPPEECREREGLSVPVLLGWRDEKAVLKLGQEEKRASVGEVVWGWMVVGRTSRPAAVVLERRFPRWGVFVYVGSRDVLAEIRKPVGDLARLPPPPAYDAEAIQQAQESSEDLLGHRLLSLGEPSFEAVAAWLPDLTSYTVIGTRAMAKKPVVEPTGRIGYLKPEYGPDRLQQVLFDPATLWPDLLPVFSKLGLLGGYLPAIDYGFYDPALHRGWEEIAFATDAGIFVAVRSDGPWRAYALAPLQELADAGEFFAQLLELYHQCRAFAARAIDVRLPEKRLTDAALASLIRARSTYVGDRPKYGVGFYAGAEHDAFPPTTLFMVEAELEWGLLDEARCDLDYYLQNLLRPDGTFDYYGPAVSEYGMMLERMARYVRYSGNHDWLARHYQAADRICKHLLSLRAASAERKEVARGTRGLIIGSPEADTREDVNYYYSGNMWAWRGLSEWGRLLCDTRLQPQRGRQLLAEAAALRQDIEASLAVSTIRGDFDFIPPYPGLPQPFASMVQHTLASYTNYRYWLEMLSADFLSPEAAAAIVEYRRRHKGEFFGMTRFFGHLDDWPYANYARALLTLDRIEHFLLGFYGHLAHHQMRGTFQDFEQVQAFETGGRSNVADYCVPAQLTVPLLLRWMLVFEERDRDCLWLCKAAPRRWFAAGQHFSVTAAPTRWGRLSFSVETHTNQVTVHLVPPPKPVETVYLRIRPPSRMSLRKATLNGRPAPLDTEKSCVVVRRPIAPCKILVSLSSQQ